MKKIKFLLFATGVLSVASMPLIAGQCSAKEQKSEEPKTPTNPEPQPVPVDPVNGGTDNPRTIAAPVDQYENAFVLQPAGTFAYVNAKVQEKANPISRYGLLQLYKGFNGIGIKSGGQGNDNKILLPKEGITIDQFLSTRDTTDNKYFDGTWNPETKILTIKYKIKDNGDKVYEQSFTLS
ncbi:hypothetical protein NPA13_01660 [Mycoplasma sp. 2045]|uniref:hypothetical protein n=1 Tax=Mycoplasma sp. 2045 TaxID=2967301 RepID=UPI00211BCE5B|nr:hypothetical protein [Mycoplasma sp. 2045]UUM20703.1 hypothetical protein NPA13_01660 [Mycoplasma sp. 2045]